MIIAEHVHVRHLAFSTYRSLIVAVVLLAWAGTLNAQPPGQPDVKPLVVDPEQAKALGLRTLVGRHVTLYTDVPSSPAVDELPQVFDAAVPQWAAYFNIPPAKLHGWRMNAFLMRDAKKLRDSGLLPPHIPNFPNGYSLGYELWMNEQPSDYYRRHLLLHEGTHGFMNTVLGSCGAPWFMEGLAELLGTHRWRDGKLSLGIMPRGKVEVPDLGRLPYVQDEVRADRRQAVGDIVDDAVTGYVTNGAYAWSWAFATFLDGHPKYRDRFRRLQLQVRNLKFNDEFRKFYQSDLAQLAREWQVFANELEYGVEVPRVAINFVPGKPLPAGGASVSIAADRGWQPSAVKLEAGKTYRLQASDRYTVAQSTDAAGTVKPWPCEPGGVTLRYYRGRPLGMLLAAVEPDVLPVGTPSSMLTPLAVGLGTTITPEKSGTLYFRINDSNGELADNAGSLTVEIKPSP